MWGWRGLIFARLVLNRFIASIIVRVKSMNQWGNEMSMSPVVFMSLPYHGDVASGTSMPSRGPHTSLLGNEMACCGSWYQRPAVDWEKEKLCKFLGSGLKASGFQMWACLSGIKCSKWTASCFSPQDLGVIRQMGVDFGKDTTSNSEPDQRPNVLPSTSMARRP